MISNAEWLEAAAEYRGVRLGDFSTEQMKIHYRVSRQTSLVCDRISPLAWEVYYYLLCEALKDD